MQYSSSASRLPLPPSQSNVAPLQRVPSFQSLRMGMPTGSLSSHTLIPAARNESWVHHGSGYVREPWPHGVIPPRAYTGGNVPFHTPYGRVARGQAPDPNSVQEWVTPTTNVYPLPPSGQNARKLAQDAQIARDRFNIPAGSITAAIRTTGFHQHSKVRALPRSVSRSDLAKGSVASSASLESLARASEVREAPRLWATAKASPRAAEVVEATFGRPYEQLVHPNRLSAEADSTRAEAKALHRQVSTKKYLSEGVGIVHDVPPTCVCTCAILHMRDILVRMPCAKSLAGHSPLSPQAQYHTVDITLTFIHHAILCIERIGEAPRALAFTPQARASVPCICILRVDCN